MPLFIGRDQEFKKLRDLKKKKTASFVVVRGRRRIGKSRLIEEFGKEFDHFYTISGLAPDAQITAQDQRNHFVKQMSTQLGMPQAKYDDWTDILWAFGERVKTGKTLVFFDEISWMGSKDPTFLPKIKDFWDLHLKKNDHLIFVVCGSASSWIEKNILSSKGFVGRISQTLIIEELPLSDCARFWPPHISPYEILKVLSITGGIPKYLEEIDPHISAEANINRLCFTRGALLVEEFEQIFSDLFLRNSHYYKAILQALVSGAKGRDDIATMIHLSASGRLSEYLTELELSGFITQDHTWNLKNGLDSKLRKYRLIDNYTRFYLRYTEKHLSQIKRNAFAVKQLSALPEWYALMGFQFENLVLSNRPLIHKALDLNPSEIICENPYFQTKTTKNPGCQIDYMIQTKFDTLYVCEIKFSKNEIGSSVIEEVEAKIQALKKPKHMSCRPVLIHVNGVSPRLIEEDYFATIIDFSQFL